MTNTAASTLFQKYLHKHSTTNTETIPMRGQCPFGHKEKSPHDGGKECGNLMFSQLSFISFRDSRAFSTRLANWLIGSASDGINSGSAVYS